MPGLDTSSKALRAVVAEWHRRALPFIRTKAFDETWKDFAVAWGRVRRPAGAALAAAVERARSMPTPAAASVYEDEHLRFLVALCVCLQEQHGDGPFFLSARQAADVLGTDRMDAWRMLEALRLDGIIVRKAKGTLKDRQASEWRLAG
jgi:hypothetical protein